jgi:hypothetical protein
MIPGSLNDVRNRELIVNINRKPPMIGMIGDILSARYGQLRRKKKKIMN